MGIAKGGFQQIGYDTLANNQPTLNKVTTAAITTHKLPIPIHNAINLSLSTRAKYKIFDLLQYKLYYMQLGVINFKR